MSTVNDLTIEMVYPWHFGNRPTSYLDAPLDGYRGLELNPMSGEA